MLSKIDKELAFVQSALDLRARRQEILAANIANSDTPNYKARDMDFAAALRQALGAGAGTLALAKTAARHLDAAGSGAGAAATGHVKYRGAIQPSLDGNTVDADVERAHFTENALHYQFLLERAASGFRTLGRAIESSR
jgi:flagellar basal-body rod protein FlgB